MTRYIPLLLLCFVVAACDRAVGEAFVSPRLPPGAPMRAWPPQGWAWGLLQVKDHPPMRYGVSAPATDRIGDIVILPGYGESAEVWFETASDLNSEGYRVWILDGEGQGGSGRFTAIRDLGHTPDFTGDIEGIGALVALVIRPPDSRPVILMASGTAAMTAVAAVSEGVPASRVILSGPGELTVGSGGIPAVLAKVGVTTMRASGGSPWARPAKQSTETPRQKIALGWALANPDLRMGGPSTGWIQARKALRAEATSAQALGRVTVPVTVIAPQAAGSIPCDRLPRCMVHPLPASAPYHLADDQTRAAWFSALIGELGTDHAA